MARKKKNPVWERITELHLEVLKVVKHCDTSRYLISIEISSTRTSFSISDMNNNFINVFHTGQMYPEREDAIKSNLTKIKNCFTAIKKYYNL